MSKIDVNQAAHLTAISPLLGENMTKSITATETRWPSKITQEYEPVRDLGKGGFASVKLARRKRDGKLVAMKVVGSKNSNEKTYGYAHREIDILREIDHPNIVGLVDSWEPEDRRCAAMMALDHANGPTLLDLLEKGGALNPLFVRVVASQLVDAVAYLHYRAVIHRDIKPDNIIVEGAQNNQHEVWDDVLERPSSDNGWKELLSKWKVTLVDFGFARALTPADMQKPAPKRSRRNLDASAGSASSYESQLSKSISRRMTRKMSAVGNRDYAAPEVTKNIEFQDASYHNDGSSDITHTLSSHVSYYGLLADAFSIGNTIKYMVTGAPPREDVDGLIDLINSPFGFLFRCCLDRTDDTERKVRFRRASDVPSETTRIIRATTSSDPTKRTSARALRLYPWIDDVLVERTSFGLRDIQYLNVAALHRNA